MKYTKYLIIPVMMLLISGVSMAQDIVPELTDRQFEYVLMERVLVALGFTIVVGSIVGVMNMLRIAPTREQVQMGRDSIAGVDNSLNELKSVAAKTETPVDDLFVEAFKLGWGILKERAETDVFIPAEQNIRDVHESFRSTPESTGTVTVPDEPVVQTVSSHATLTSDYPAEQLKDSDA